MKELLTYLGVFFLLLGVAFAFVKPVLTGAAIGSASLGVGSLGSFTAAMVSLIAANMEMKESKSLEQVLRRKKKRKRILKKMKKASTAEALGSCLKVFFKGKKVGSERSEKVLSMFSEEVLRKIEREDDIEQLKKVKNMIGKAMKLSEAFEVQRRNKEIIRSFYAVTNQKLLQVFYE